MNDGVRLADVREKLVSETFTLAGALHDTRNIDDGSRRRHDPLGLDDVADFMEAFIGTEKTPTLGSMVQKG